MTMISDANTTLAFAELLGGRGPTAWQSMLRDLRDAAAAFRTARTALVAARAEAGVAEQGLRLAVTLQYADDIVARYAHDWAAAQDAIDGAAERLHRATAQFNDVASAVRNTIGALLRDEGTDFDDDR